MSASIPDAVNWPEDLRAELESFLATLGPDPTPECIRQASLTLSPEARLYLAGRGLEGFPEPPGEDPPPAG